MSNYRRAIAAGLATLAAAAVAAGCGIALEPKPQVPEYRACATEDDKGPCTWDATKQGNGQGKSFTVLPDGTTAYWPTEGKPSKEWQAARESERTIARRIYNVQVDGCEADLQANYIALTKADAWPDKDGERVAIIPGSDDTNLAIHPYDGACE